MWKFDVGVLVTAEAVYGIGFPREEDLEPETPSASQPESQETEQEAA